MRVEKGMSTAIFSSDLDNEETVESEVFPYKVVSKSAVVGLVLAFFSLSGYLFAGMLVLALVGLLASWVALGRIRSFPEEYTGKSLAVIGLFVNATVLVSGMAYHSYVYATEVPEGFERIGFSQLQPDDPDGAVYPPQDAFGLDGKKVFIKGYMYPDSQTHNISRFVLIPDLGTCCFGGQPKLTNMVEVTLDDPLRLSFGRTKRKLAGTFRVNPHLKQVNKVGGVFYELDANFAR